MRKNLIIYDSLTGNTQMIAEELKKNFERYNWLCDLKKIDDKYDTDNLDFDFMDYDFVCVGSPVISELPLSHVRNALYQKELIPMKRIDPGPKCGIVFCTYGGVHLGPKEAEPSLKLLEVELEHLKFKVIGSLAIPGKMKNRGSEAWYHPDLKERPNESDLKRVAEFVDDIIHKLEENDFYS